LEALRAELRIDRLLADLPSLIEGTVEGAERTRDIVDSLKRFSAVDRNETSPSTWPRSSSRPCTGSPRPPPTS
jgi:two-component system sensor histidine kinase HupT/HoxJ